MVEVGGQCHGWYELGRE